MDDTPLFFETRAERQVSWEPRLKRLSWWDRMRLWWFARRLRRQGRR